MVDNPQLRNPAATTRALTTTHALLTNVWTDDVKVLEGALRRSGGNGGLSGSCHVTFFEVAGDSQLHVKVMHMYPARELSGSAATVTPPDGFVYGRSFDRAPRYQLLRQIRNMVFP